MSHFSFALADVQEHFLSHVIVGIEDLCTKRDELQKQIINEEEEKSKIQNDIRILSERLAKINESLAKKIASRNEYDKTISETEAAYMKVMHQSFEILAPPSPNPLGPWRGIAGTFTSHTLHFGSPVSGEFARSHREVSVKLLLQ